jgi:2-polyprenyl-3-methyl-5-hydroxy-6-metoxy-1,4-benzoquinol methylase
MTRRMHTISPDYFDALYAADADPWRFRTSDYERDKYAATLAALSRPRYRRVLDAGCSIGVFTALLATRCEAVLAVDASTVALETARETCSAYNNVTFECCTVPARFPPGPFDLIVLSEVIYYLDAPDVHRLAERCADALSPEGEIVTCHWLGETDYPLTGAMASELFALAMIKRLPDHAILQDREYRLDRLSRA